jgi:hypothetical protein
MWFCVCTELGFHAQNMIDIQHSIVNIIVGKLHDHFMSNIMRKVTPTSIWICLSSYTDHVVHILGEVCYIHYPHQCMILFGVLQCNILLRSSISTNKSSIGCSDIIEHK